MRTLGSAFDPEIEPSTAPGSQKFEQGPTLGYAQCTREGPAASSIEGRLNSSSVALMLRPLVHPTKRAAGASTPCRASVRFLLIFSVSEPRVPGVPCDQARRGLDMFSRRAGGNKGRKGMYIRATCPAFRRTRVGSAPRGQWRGCFASRCPLLWAQDGDDLFQCAPRLRYRNGRCIESNRAVFQAYDGLVNFMLPVGNFGETEGLPI